MKELCSVAPVHSVAFEKSFAILSDEVFSDFALAPDPARVATLAEGCKALTFSMSGLSKIVGLPQMKLADVAAR